MSMALMRCSIPKQNIPSKHAPLKTWSWLRQRCVQCLPVAHIKDTPASGHQLWETTSVESESGIVSDQSPA